MFAVKLQNIEEFYLLNNQLHERLSSSVKGYLNNTNCYACEPIYDIYGNIYLYLGEDYRVNRYCSDIIQPFISNNLLQDYPDNIFPNPLDIEGED